MVRACLVIAVMSIESFFMLGLRTDVVHRDNFHQAYEEAWAIHKSNLGHYITIIESANMHPEENVKILASNDARWKGWKRTKTIRKDMTYLLVYEKE